MCDGVGALRPGLWSRRFPSHIESEFAEDWYSVACSTYLEAASTGLAACLRAPSKVFAKEFVFNCCFEGFEFG